jgi:DNA-binding NtrC family response regulator
MKPHKSTWTILVIDRSRNVRRYLMRELESEGYQVLLAENCRQAIEMAHDRTPLDLIIIDPDLPDEGSTSLLLKLQRLRPHTPLIVHSLANNGVNQNDMIQATEVVEKEGRSIERLKRVVKSHLGVI